MKVLIADDHWISRAGLSHLLSTMDAECAIAEATSFAEAATLLGQEGFDVCLLDPTLADMEPMEGLKHLRETAVAVPIVVMTMQASRRFALQAVEHGAQGFVSKTASAAEISRAIRRVMEGEIVLPANLRDLPAGNSQDTSEAAAPQGKGATDNPLAMLTARQRDVLGLIATGKRNAEIGAALNISPRTVQIHVSTILKLLNVGNRTEAALLARKYGTGQGWES